MRIQRIVISQSEHPSLYFRGGTAKEGRITRKEGERLSFDTYFNCFSYTKYREYTKAREITFCGKLQGEATVSLCVYDGKEERTVASVRADHDFSLTVPMDSLPAHAFLYPAVIATQTTVFLEGAYFADTEGEKLSCAIAICTFRREEYLKNNLKILKDASIPYIDRVLVIDNGHTVSPDEIPLGVSLFQNPNYGGSAGFTRGIMEAKRGGYTHVILMDDDIVIYPEALERMTAFLSILKPAYKNAHLSAAMLPTSRLYLQHEKGARWDGSRIESMHTKLDVRDRDALIENLSDGPIEYGAWWCFCLPLTDVDTFGLPLPLFIKFDDVEYGTRCCKQKAPIITMSGMAVAHADFDGKYNMHLDYYTIRNQLIMLASHRMQNALGCILRLAKVSVKNLFLYRYSAMPIILRAFDDFLRGADFLMSVNAEKLNREIMAMSPASTELSALPDWDPALRTSYTPSKKNPFLLGIKLLTLGGHIIPRCFMKKKTAAAPLPSAKVGDCFLHRHTIQYQEGSDTGYVFDKNSRKFFSCFASAIKMSVRILFSYRRAAKSYREKFPEMTSHDFWTRYLGL